MEQKISVQADTSTGLDEVRICVGGATELTLGSGGGSSEDKRYVYN